MISKTFAFTKIQKTPEKIETDLNSFLAKHEFKYATQNESATIGKFIVTVVGVKGKSSIRAKVFRDQRFAELDAKVNEFLAKHGMKFMTQTFVGSSIYTIVFYDSKSEAPTTNTDGTDTNSDGTNQN